MAKRKTVMTTELPEPSQSAENKSFCEDHRDVETYAKETDYFPLNTPADEKICHIQK